MIAVPSGPFRRCLAILCLVAGVAVTGCTGSTPEPSAGAYSTGPASRDGTGKFYLGREIAIPVGHRAAGWLERPDRADSELPERVVDNLELSETSVVADIGAGTGYFTFRIAPQVPQGRVYAVDISPEMMDIIRKRGGDEVENVETVLGDLRSPNLPEAAIDVALIVDAYHEFSHPVEMLEGLARALRPGGVLVLVEYRGEDPAVPIKPLHKMTEGQVRAELAPVGFEFVENRSFLPQQHFLVFRKSGTADRHRSEFPRSRP